MRDIVRLELTKKTDLAFQALEYIAASKGARVTGADLAEELDITTQYLPHVVSPLTRVGWIISTSGPRGGYTIGTDFTDLTLLNLVEVVEGEFDDTRCLHLGPRHGVNHHCALHEPWMLARNALINELDKCDLLGLLVIPD